MGASSDIRSTVLANSVIFAALLESTLEKRVLSVASLCNSIQSFSLFVLKISRPSLISATRNTAPSLKHWAIPDFYTEICTLIPF